VGFEQVRRKRKKNSSGSTDAFASLPTDDKLVCIFEQINKTYDKIRNIESQQAQCNSDVQKIKQNYKELDTRVRRMEELCDMQAWNAKVLSYKSIDTEARSMRNNLIVYGLTERLFGDPKTLVRNFLSRELGIDTEEMEIERAHRLGRVNFQRRGDGVDQKRPMVVRFRDYVDTETIMTKAYRLKEISRARSELYNSEQARTARRNGQKVQLQYPAKLLIDRKLVLDKFTDWYEVLGTSRVASQVGSVSQKKQDRAYSDDTVIDFHDTKQCSQSDSDTVFEQLCLQTPPDPVTPEITPVQQSRDSSTCAKIDTMHYRAKNLTNNRTRACIQR